MMKTVPREYWPTQEWRTAEPAAVGIDPDRLSELEQLINSRYKKINGIVVVRKGYIAFERYYNGYSLVDAHHVASVTKSLISALIGIALDTGHLQSVDQQVLSFFPEYSAGAADIRKRSITIKHLLTMTAPFALTKGKSEPLDRLRRQRDWVHYILKLMGGKGQTGSFQYSTAGAHLLSAIITRATGCCARELANQHLFRPVGMREIPDHEMKSFSIDDVFGKNVTGWIKDPSGNTAGGWGLTITPRDMARFGFLYLNNGKWAKQQIISKGWVEESTTPHSETVIDNSLLKYGYLWWLKEENDTSIYLAMGSGGNIICCIPDKDLVVAIASKIVRKPLDRWPLFEKYILPAVSRDQ